jgi:hypothetical protein
MLQQTTNLGIAKPPEYHCVVDEHAPAPDTIGRVLGVFATAAKARTFAGNLSYAAKVAKTGARIDLALAPHVNTAFLREIISESPNVRPRIVRLTSDLPPGSHVHPRLHLAPSPTGALRCL